MRRNVRIFSVFLVLFVAAAAIAGSVTHTSSATWGTGTQTNITIGNELELTTVINEVDDWYRHDWDDETWEAQGNKDNGNGMFVAADRCLRDNDNNTINGPIATVNGHEFRTGTGTVGVGGTNYVSTVPPATPVPLPTGMDFIDGVRFLTSGARIAENNYTVRFHYTGGITRDVVVPIALDTVTGGARDDAGTNYTIDGITVLTRNQAVTWDADGANGTDCAGNGGDDVIVDNPLPGSTVLDIEFLYTDFEDDAAATGWLGGPLAVSLITDEVEIESTYTYRGEYVSASSTANAVNAGTHAIWYRVSWSASIPSGSEILLHLTCGDDDNGNGTIAGGELAPEQTYALSGLASPYTLPVQCSGRYLLYRVEIIDEFDDEPALNSITFTYDPDADEDGYGADGNATAADCDDDDPTIHPGATEIVGDEIDQNCDGGEICYDDNDNDGSRHATNTRVSANVTCIGNQEGRASDPIDCDDNDATRFVGATEIVGDDVDQNCDGHDACYRDADRDGHGTTVVVTAVAATCLTANQEAKVNDDCDDANADRHPGNDEVVGDNVDQNCDDREVCYRDADNDGARHATLTVTTAPGDHDCTGPFEGEATDAIDCDDNDSDAFPGNDETVGDENDNDCDGTEICFLDNDDDGYRHATNTIVSTNESCRDFREGRLSDGIDCDDNVATTNPGAPDICGNGVDDNCDGVGNWASASFLDDDGDGLPFALEVALGTSDCNLDSDGDGLNDDIEHLVLFTNPALQDTDGDGRNDAEEVGADIANPINTDGDALIDALDPDDDNDGILSLQELLDPDGGDGDGVPNWFDLDSDGDGYSDSHEWTQIAGGLRDQDGDGRNNYVDQDSDDDTVLDTHEVGNQAAPADSDGDGVPDRLDNDDDADCVLTRDEVGNPLPGLQSNFDGDALVDYLDNDDDNDGEMSCVEDPDGDGNPANDDTDNDGQPNHKDDDDDADLIPTLVENTQPAGRDMDFDGLVNSIDLDSDGDLWLDLHESSFGNLVHSDGDIHPDFLDLDSDNDLVPDEREGSSTSQIDTDRDGLLDRVDTDDDDDLILTAEECSTSCGNNIPWDDDFDEDGIPDYIDEDDDNDGVRTRQEDVDGDGDPRNDNSDANLTFPDAQPDYLDMDDDGDGIATIDEDPDGDGRPSNDDTDRDGFPDYRDEDDDGDALFTFNETELRDFETGTDDPQDYDLDGDGVANYRDADDDGDGVDTICEITFGVSHLVVDNDGDTILDGAEWINSIYLLALGGAPLAEAEYRDDNGGLSGTDCFNPWDRDSDGIVNALDADDDGDGLVSGADEVGVDFDCLPGTQVPAGDGIPDYYDRDSDNDGIPDGITGIGDEGLGDADGDGIPDFLDCDDSGDAGDSDLDGILNGAERALCADMPGMNCMLDPDVDRDGIIDGVESGLDLSRLLDTDGDGTPDMFDEDDDGDGQPSATENLIVGCATPVEPRFCFYSEDGVVPDNFPCARTPTGPDDGYWRFRCRDTLGNQLWFDFGGNALEDYQNTDRATGGPLPRSPDAIPDFRDTDDDGDYKLTIIEGMDDDDGDGLPNAYDPDDHDGPEADPDRDGLITRHEVSLGTQPYDPDSDRDGVADGIEIGDMSAPFDHDGDSIIDALDPDDDNDTIHTLIEGVADIDGDGIPNYLDLDSDGDGKLDRDEGADRDDDCDGLWNAYDPDDTDGPCMNGGLPSTGDAYTAVGCGCASGAPGAPAGLVVVLTGLLALRRRAVPSRHHGRAERSGRDR